MLCREIIAFCSEIHTKHINSLCGQNVVLLNVNPGGAYNDHCFDCLITHSAMCYIYPQQCFRS